MKVRRSGRFVTFVFSDEELPGILSSMRDIGAGKSIALASCWEGGDALNVEIALSNDDEMLLDKKSISMRLEQESLEYAIHKIEEMMINKSPSTPEFLEFRLQGNARDRQWKGIHTYFELEQESNGA